MSLKEQDWHCKLILAYYSMNLVPALLLEGCLSTLIKSALSNGTYEVGHPVELAPLFKVVHTYADLFRNESLSKAEVNDEVIL